MTKDVTIIGILRKLLRLNPPKPVTKKELRELKMRAEKEETKSRIAISKGQQWKARQEKIESIYKIFSGAFGPSHSATGRERSRRDEVRFF